MPSGLRARFPGALITLAVLGCAGAPPPPPPEPVDAEGISESIRLATRLDQPVRILFDWNLNESGSRTSGRGVVRMEPPYKARIDLFNGKGETVLRAALVDDVLHLPPGVTSQNVVPQPALLWAALGVFRPGAHGYLAGGEAIGDRQVQLRYGYGGSEEVRFRVSGGTMDLAELLRGGRVAERVEVQASESHQFPQEAVYRNMGDFRELTLTLDAYERVDVFPPDIWLPNP